MHILITPSWYPKTPTDIGGSFFREQALALKKHGHQVGVIYPQMRSVRDWCSIFKGAYTTEEYIDNGMPTFKKHGMNWFPRMPSLVQHIFVQNGFTLFQNYIKKHGLPDIIHAHSILNGGVLSYEIQQKYDIPFVLTEHSSAYARQLIKKSQLKNIITVSNASQQRFAVSLPFAQLLERYTTSTWQVMPNIVSGNFLTHHTKELGRAQDFTFINIALLTENKGIHHLINAFAKSFKDTAKVKLVIGGDGPERKRLEALVQQLNMSGQIRFLGYLQRHEVLEQVAAANAFVLSSRYETFGVVVIEALALGKPVVVTRCGGPEDIVQTTDGILVPPDNVEELANAMQTMYGEYHHYNSDQIRANCTERFSEQAIATRLTECYKEVLNT